MFSYAVPSRSGGAGYAMVSDGYLAALGAAGARAHALALWQACGDGESEFDDLVAAVGDTPDAALVELVDAAARTMLVAVRGAAIVRLVGAEKTTDAVTATPGTWTRREVSGVTGLELRVPGEDEDDLDLEDPTRDDLDELPFGRGVVRSSRLLWGERPPARPVAHAPAPALAEDEVLETLAVDRLEDTLLSVRRSPAPVLRLHDGRTVPLDLPVVLGRSLRPAAHPGARLISVSSPQREVSGTHLELRLHGDDLHARDLDSTNGTIVRDADGDATLLRHGATAIVRPGAVLDLGDGVTVSFEEAVR